MSWLVGIHPEFRVEFQELDLAVRQELFIKVKLIEDLGPQLGRPHADTLVGSKHSNMKELRFSAANGVWRVAFAFDPKRQAVLLIAGDKAGVNQKRFYKDLLKKADQRFDTYLNDLSSGD